MGGKPMSIGMKSAAQIVSTAILATGLSGCVSMRGTPEPVITVADTRKIVAEYKIPAILTRYRDLSEPAKTSYRNEVLAAYSQAIDANYFAFRTGLSSESRQAGLAFDIGLLGYASLATVVESAAENLAAASALAAGSRAAVDKNLYFEQTIAALIAGMDAERLNIRTGIVQKMSLPAADYPLTAALSDLVEYQNAGTLDHAITVITDEAVKERVAAKERFDDMVRFACTPEQLTRLDEAQERQLGKYNSDLLKKAVDEAEAGGDTRTYRDALKRSADIYSVSLPEGLTTIDTVEDIQLVGLAIAQNYLKGYCTDAEIASVIEKIQADATLNALLPATQ